MKRLFFLLTTPLLLTLSSCEKEVENINIPDKGIQLVVTSFISPQDSVLEVKVQESQPVLGWQSNDPFAMVKDATVRLSDGSREVLLPMTNSNSGQGPGQSRTFTYRTEAKNFPIEAGKTYLLNVSVPDGRQVEASCTVPAAFPELPEVTVEPGPRTSGEGSGYFMRMFWNDIPGENNFYRIAGNVEMVRNARNGTRPDTTFQSIYWQPEEQSFYSDRSKDGEALNSERQDIFTYQGPPEQLFKDYQSVTLKAYLLHTDRNYYEYHRSVYRASRSQDNPFAEPVLVYSNIQNGLGIFAAFNRKTVEVRIK